MQASLVGPTGSLPLGAGIVTVGRTSDNQFIVNDPKASSHHAEIRQEGQSYAIVDMGSTNGTFMDEQRLERGILRQLRPGDRIRIGDTTFTYEVQLQQDVPLSVPPAYGVAQLQGNQPAVMANNAYPAYAPPPPQMVGAPLYPPSPTPSYPSVPAYGAAPTALNYAQVSPSQPKRRRRGIWIGGILLVVLLLGLGAGAYVYVNRATPARTLDAFCAALKRGDYATAYGQLSTKLQHKAPQAVFASLLGKISVCSYTGLNQADATASARLTLTSSGQTSNDVVKLLQDSSNSWKIDDEPGMTALPNALDIYCSALKSGNYTAAYAQLSENYQNKVSQSLFTAYLPSVSSCAYTLGNVTASSATATLVSSYSQGQVETDSVTLLQSGSNDWKIDSLSALSTPTKSLNTFCASFKSKDYQTAYDLLASDYQAGFGSEGKFAAALDKIFTSYKGVASCQVSNVQQNGSSATGTNVITYGDGRVETDSDSLIVENSVWKIDTIK